jgi:5'-nucleotidase (lipoprotein e(P4) family)
MKKIITIASVALISIFVTAFTINYIQVKTQPDEQSVLGVLYQQQAGEYRALCLQSYNIARLRINEALNSKKPHKPYAIITDLDETALDNSESSAWNYRNDTTATLANLLAWQLLGKAKAVPGSVSFFNWVKQQNVKIYYISNRVISTITATRNNMAALKFPYCSKGDEQYFLFKSDSSNSPNSKEKRRQMVAANHTVILLLGDNLGDHDVAFDGKDNPGRNAAVDSLKKKWGDKYIVFPNSVYGDWEQAFYKVFKAAHPTLKLNQAMRDSIRRTFLMSYTP